MSAENEEKKFYEIGFVFDAEDNRAEVIKLIKDLEGEILKEGEVFKIRLAYLIKKQSSGFFSFLQFFLKPENLTSLKKTLKLNPSILRFLVIRLGEKEEKIVRFISVGPAIKGINQKAVDALSNEELEKKIEEILK